MLQSGHNLEPTCAALESIVYDLVCGRPLVLYLYSVAAWLQGEFHLTLHVIGLPVFLLLLISFLTIVDLAIYLLVWEQERVIWLWMWGLGIFKLWNQIISWSYLLNFWWHAIGGALFQVGGRRRGTAGFCFYFKYRPHLSFVISTYYGQTTLKNFLASSKSCFLPRNILPRQEVDGGP